VKIKFLKNGLENNKKTILIGSIMILFAVLFSFFVLKNIYKKDMIIFPENATYYVENQEIKLQNSQIFLNPVYKDLDQDDDEDAILMFTQSPGGSGTFFYVAAAINETGSFRGTNAILLGDRIAPQNINFLGSTVVVNYAERKPEDPMTTQPSVKVSKYLIIENGTLKETDQPAG